MKNNIKLLSILISIVICLKFVTKSVLSEPIVVLEFRNNNSKSFEVSNEVSNNPFLNDQNFSMKYKVKKNETLSDIILKNYGVKHFNKDVLSLSIVHFNKHAFVRKNPNFLFANKTLHLPSVLEIKNLIIKTKPNHREYPNDEKHIYFFGG
jgi:nucleoid-associated protein YgaU